MMPEIRRYRYAVVDVFTADGPEGNPPAGFPDASDLDAGTVQKIARELNLAEATFAGPS
jgi:predicted PhzF superfamily epimerase YddE/YHI9